MRKNGLYSGVVLLLNKDKEEINEMGLYNGGLNRGVVLKRGFTVYTSITKPL